jgi:hypothetical protein
MNQEKILAELKALIHRWGHYRSSAYREEDWLRKGFLLERSTSICYEMYILCKDWQELHRESRPVYLRTHEALRDNGLDN